MTETSRPNRVHLNLDSLDRERVVGVPDKKTDPYVVTFAGRELTFADASELPYETVLNMDTHPTIFFRSTLSEEDYAFFREHSRQLKGWQLRALMDGYRGYYGLDEQGNVVGSRR